MSPIYASRAEGARFWDVDGHEYIDWVSGIAAIILGYCDQRVDQAVVEQITQRGTLSGFSTPLDLEVEDVLHVGAAGIAAELREEVRATLAEERAAALALARKRRLGPFGPAPADRQAIEKQVAVFLRAGHRLDIARQIVKADDVAGLEAWVMEEE